MTSFSRRISGSRRSSLANMLRAKQLRPQPRYTMTAVRVMTRVLVSTASRSHKRGLVTQRTSELVFTEALLMGCDFVPCGAMSSNSLSYLMIRPPLYQTRILFKP